MGMEPTLKPDCSPHPCLGLDYYSLPQGLANFFCKGPESKYLRRCGPYNLLQPSVLPLFGRRAIDSAWINEHEGISVKLYLQNQAQGQIWLRGHNLLTPAVVCQKLCSDSHPPLLKFKLALNAGLASPWSTLLALWCLQEYVGVFMFGPVVLSRRFNFKYLVCHYQKQKFCAR